MREIHESRLTAVEKSIDGLSKQTNTLDKLVTKLLVGLDGHIKERAEFETTLRNIDNNVNSLQIDYAREPLRRSEDVNKVVRPLWIHVRKSDAEIDGKIKANGDEVANSLNKSFKSHLSVIWVMGVIIVSMALYIYNTDRNGWEKEIKHIEMRIDKLSFGTLHKNGKY